MTSQIAAADTFRDWDVHCGQADGAGVCILSQTAFAGDRTWLATIQLIVEPDMQASDAIPVVLRVPEGVHLASGIFLADGSTVPRQAQWHTCGTGYCEAVAELDPAAVRAWQAGSVAEVRYRPRRDQNAVAFDVSLLGVTAALRSAREALQ